MRFKEDKLRSHTKAYPSQNDNSQRCEQNLKQQERQNSI